ncbi:YtcA family lipoprotein [Phenylobacterium sp.]|uniref:YtcA family lipoprotein n=1 Tax=Phenylobacterium sp. TaxID=1871053 RepID=UPI0035AE9CFF
MGRLRALPVSFALGLSGCAAPSVSAFGAYFPAWLLCMLLGVAAAIAARVVFVTLKLADVIPAQLFVCAAIGAIVASLLWLIWIG